MKLGERPAQVGQMMQDGMAEDQVEAGIGEWERLGLGPGGAYLQAETLGVAAQRGDHPG